MTSQLPQFGLAVPGAEYVLRPGGYVVLVDAAGAVGVVAVADGVVLLGGGQDACESPDLAAVREALEECGLRVRLGDCLGVADELVFAVDEETYFRKRCTFFTAEVVERSGPGEADHELVWLAPAEAIARLRFESQRWAVNSAATRVAGTPCGP